MPRQPALFCPNLLTALFTPSCLVLSLLMVAQANAGINPPTTEAPALDPPIYQGVKASAKGNTQPSALTPADSAPTAPDYQYYRRLAEQKQLFLHPTWRRLLYFKDSNKVAKTAKSLVDNPKFFITPNGGANPQAELEALLQLMLAPASLNANTDEDTRNQLLCRFPARVHWLKDQLNIADSAVASIACPEFDAWMSKLDPQKLSVIYAEEYLDNPLSAFGHTLMLIDSTKSLADPTAIGYAHALNDTVAGNPEDNFLVYAVKSMVGKYPNDITIDPYPEKLSYYVQGDERDVWTYPLALSKAEVQQIMRHVWETKDLALPYYFTTDNCASEILRYIDVVRPEGNLLNQLPYVVVPSDVVRLLTKEGLITEQNYLPADDTLRQAQLNQTSAAQSTLNTSSPNDRQALPSSTISKDGKKLQPTQLVPVNNNPNNAHPLHRGLIGGGQKGDLGYLTLGFRAGFNDLLDRPDGYPQHFDLEGLSATLRLYDNDDQSADNFHPNYAHQNRVEVQDITLIRGRSFNPINTETTGKTWGLNLGATRVNDGSKYQGDDHLVANVAYEQGVSMAFGTPRAGTGELPPQLCYALGTGMGQLGKGINKGWRAGIGVNVGCRYQISPKLRAHAEIEAPYWYHGSVDQGQKDQDGQSASGHYWQPIAHLGVQYDIDRSQALRLQGSYEFQDRVRDQDQWQLAYVKYF